MKRAEYTFLCLMVLAAGLTATVPGGAAAAESVCHVRYLSAEHVYLDAGAVAGLEVGMRARVVRDGKAVAELEVVFTADNSASCRIVSKSVDIAAGDRVVYEPETPPDEPDTSAQPTSRTRDTADRKLGRGRGDPLRIRGWTALQWDHSQETTDHKLATDLLRVPFRLKATGLGSDVEFRGRGTFRRILRSGYSASTPSAEWRNRILEASFVREGRDLTWQFAVGRVGSRRTASAGPFDGLEVTRRFGEDLRIGVFGGFAPDWGDLGFNTEDHLGGAVVNLRRSGEKGRMLDLTGAAIARYRQGEISREYVLVTTTWRDGGRWSLLQAAEIDINRGWRKDAKGQSLSLTSGALSGRYQLTKQVSFNLGYDNREPVRTWETRSLPDSLFTDAGRSGYRGGASLRTRGGVSLNVSGGIRSEDGTNEKVRSWNAYLRVPDRFLRLASLSIHARGFDGPWLSGFSPGILLNRYTRSGMRLSLDLGRFEYTGNLDQDKRINTWAELGCGKDVAENWEAFASFRNDWGDDIDGMRWFLELTRRF